MGGIKNIIFDFDGTLANTSRLIVATMQKSILDLDLPYKSEEEIKSVIGIRLEEIPSFLWRDIDGIGSSFAEVYRHNFDKLKKEIPITLFPGVKNCLEELKKNGYHFAIATSRSNRSVEGLASKTGIRVLFDYVVGGDDVENGKPDPESIKKILDKMKWAKDETMMVGDMGVDIQMGKNIDMKTCGVTYGNGKKPDLEKEGADYIISEFNDLKNILGNSCQ